MAFKCSVEEPSKYSLASSYLPAIPSSFFYRLTNLRLPKKRGVVGMGWGTDP